MQVDSHEYKVMLDPGAFVHPRRAVQAVWRAIEEKLAPQEGVRVRRELNDSARRQVQFLDTPDFALRRQDLLLRQRAGPDRIEYTLKCRTEDGNRAAETDVRAADGWRAEEKLEEDIAAPLRGRLAHTSTIMLVGKARAAIPRPPRTLQEFAPLFPLLGQVQCDGFPCPPDTALAIVHGITVDERVWNGGRFTFTHEGDRPHQHATVALILWTPLQEERPAVAELSFRLQLAEAQFDRHLSDAAAAAFRTLCQLEWARPDGQTKTAYIYRDGGTD